MQTFQIKLNHLSTMMLETVYLVWHAKLLSLRSFYFRKYGLLTLFFVAAEDSIKWLYCKLIFPYGWTFRGLTRFAIMGNVF